MNSTPTRPLNVSYLVMGLVFLGIAGTWALHEAGVVDGSDVEWLVPLTLVAAGLLGLLVFTTRHLRGASGRISTDDGGTTGGTTGGEVR